MSPIPKLKDWLKKAREQSKVDRAQKSFKTVTKNFRPRKGERGTYVFLRAKTQGKLKAGERVSYQSTAPTYAFYITKQGKKKFIGSGANPFKARRIDSHNLGTRKYRKAFKAVYEARRHVRAKGGNTKWDGMAREIESSLYRDRSEGAITWYISVIALVEIGGKRETIEFTANLRLPPGASVTRANIRKFIRTALYSKLAAELAARQAVTRASANRIKKLKHNRRKKKEDWKTKGGKSWGKEDYKTAKIIRLDWEAGTSQPFEKNKPNEFDDDNEPF